MSLRTTLLFSALILIITLLPCPSQAASQPDHPTTRVISMVPNITEFLFAMGADQQVVGVSNFCDYPEAALRKPRMGGFLNPDIEKIISLRPDLVILINSQEELSDKLTSLRIQWLQVKTDSLADVYDSVQRSGAAIGLGDKARKLLDSVKSEIDTVGQSYASRSPVRALIIVGRQPGSLQNIYAAGRQTYLGELMKKVGGVNLAPDSHHPYPSITKEQIVTWNPDVIIDTSLGEAGGQAETVAVHKKVWQHLPMVNAVKHNRIHYIADPHMTIPGPGIPATAKLLGELLHDSATTQSQSQ